MIALALPPSAEAVRPGSLFSLDLPQVGPQRFLVEKAERGETIKVEATIYAAGGLRRARRASPARRRVFVEPAASAVLARLPRPPGPRPARPRPDHGPATSPAHAAPWPGGFDLYRSAEESDGLRLRTPAAACGRRSARPLTALRSRAASGPGRARRSRSGYSPGRWSPGPTPAVLAGANTLAVEHSPGASRRTCNSPTPGWSAGVLSTVGAPFTGNAGTTNTRRRPRRSRRGRGSSLLFSTSSVLAAELIRRPVASGNFSWRYGPPGRTPEARGPEARAHTLRRVGNSALRAYSGLTARAGSRSGDLGISSMRRTRIEGDLWRDDDSSVRLGETGERTGSRSARGRAGPRWTVTGTTWTTYTAAQQAADEIAAPFKVRVERSRKLRPRRAAEVEFDRIGVPMSTARFGFPYIAADQAQKHVTHNAALDMLDATIGGLVASATTTTAPGSPAEGEAYSSRPARPASATPPPATSRSGRAGYGSSPRRSSAAAPSPRYRHALVYAGTFGWREGDVAGPGLGRDPRPRDPRGDPDPLGGFGHGRGADPLPGDRPRGRLENDGRDHRGQFLQCGRRRRRLALWRVARHRRSGRATSGWSAPSRSIPRRTLIVARGTAANSPGTGRARRAPSPARARGLGGPHVLQSEPDRRGGPGRGSPPT